MKICPQCETGYHDSHTTCPTHGGVLSEIRDLRPGMLIRDTYRIIRKLGKGGMGSVYLAQHVLMEEPRALKFLSEELTEDDAFTTRFLREVRTLRQVRNKNVVDCGDPERAEDGSLFFSMEFVDGPSLRSFLKTAPRPFDVRLALEITRGIAEGLGAAHAKGMVHRDIKPDNILLSPDGENWTPKIVDFGIVATKESSHQTRTGSMLLTMAYAAPEQWKGTRAAELDGRTDFYALGGVLFDMLTGQSVFEAESYHEWAQKHLNAAPPAPSSLRPDLAKWKGLDELVLRMLAKDRKDRPQDVPELLKLISAVVYDPTVAQQSMDSDATIIVTQASRFRQSGPASGQWTGSNQREADVPLPTPPPRGFEGASWREAESPQPIPAQTAPPVATPAYSAPPAPAEPPTESQPVAAAPVTAPARAPIEKLDTEAYATLGAYKTGRTSRTTQRQFAGSGESEQETKRSKGGSTVIWIILLLILAGGGYYASQHYLTPKVKFVTLQSQSQSILSVAFSHSGTTLASASHDNTIQIWDVANGKALNTLQDHVDFVAFSPDSHTMGSADWDKNIKLWDVTSGQILATLAGHTGQVLCIAFSPDGRILASGSTDKTVRLWEVNGDKSFRTLQAGTSDINSVAFSPDGKILASASSDSKITLWDFATGKVLRTLAGHSGAVYSIAFSGDGHTLASGSDDKTIKFWDVATGKETRTLQGHTGPVRSIAFSVDGRTLASGSDDKTVKLWEVTGAAAAYNTLQGHTAPVLSVAFNQDGSLLASGSADNTVRLWDTTTLRNQ